MKTVHIETGRHLYGGALQVLHLVSGLVERGLDAQLLAPKGSNVAVRARELRIPHQTFPFRGEGDVLGVIRMAQTVSRLGPDLVHLHSRRGADTWGALAAAANRIPAVLTRRVDDPEPAWSFGWKYGRYRHVIAISDAIERVLLDRGLSPSKLTRVYSAVETREWDNPVSRRALEREFDLPARAPAAAMVAQFIVRKGHAVLLKALRVLEQAASRGDSEKVPVVVLFGRGPLRNRIQSEAERMGVAGRVRFGGFRPDLNKWLGAFDFCVHPALMEGLGLAALQAGAAGIPVLGANAGGVPEIVIDEETGLLSAPGDAEGLARAMRRVTMDPDQARVWGMRARTRVAEHFSVPAMVDGNLAVYERALSAG